MDLFFVAFCLGMASLVDGDLLIRGPNQSVMEGESVTLECLYSQNEYNISHVRFESFSQMLQMWHSVWPASWCFYNMNVEQVDDKMVLHVSHVASFFEGLFRCVSDDGALSAPNNVSKTLSLKVNYLGQVYLSREGYSSFLGLSQEIRVQKGDDVTLKCSASCSEEPDYRWYKEGNDWILPSPVMTLRKVSPADSGVYTCVVEHPSASLSKMRNISLVVLPEDASWFETHTGRLVLMTSLVAIGSLSLLVAALSVCIYRRKKRAETRPIDDRSQTNPIYKDSKEALHSSCGDKQPLVAV
ncbi:hemicentin-2-like [Hippocampus zosterae]|uniref:hemicentin-2-like n=1 Tax=Hippocampus zosterae TaxID=109293 RepID=UPI00223E8977|nr:hemicentin-2-like [Hippocampus zosterae]